MEDTKVILMLIVVLQIQGAVCGGPPFYIYFFSSLSFAFCIKHIGLLKVFIHAVNILFQALILSAYSTNTMLPFFLIPIFQVTIFFPIPNNKRDIFLIYPNGIFNYFNQPHIYFAFKLLLFFPNDCRFYEDGSLLVISIFLAVVFRGCFDRIPKKILVAVQIGYIKECESLRTE